MLQPLPVTSKATGTTGNPMPPVVTVVDAVNGDEIDDPTIAPDGNE